jgi:hypothetical protein
MGDEKKLNPTEQMHHDARAQIKSFQEQNKKEREEKLAAAKKAAAKAAEKGHPTKDPFNSAVREQVAPDNAPSEAADATPGAVTPNVSTVTP